MQKWIAICLAVLCVSGCDDISDMWDDVMGEDKIVLRPKETASAPAPVDGGLRESITEPVTAPPRRSSPASLAVNNRPQMNAFGGIVIVDQVGANSAEDALHADDWIIKVNGDPVHCSDDIMERAAAAFRTSMKPLGVLIQRAGETIFLNVPLDMITRVSFLDPDSCVSWDK